MTYELPNLSGVGVGVPPPNIYKVDIILKRLIERIFQNYL